MNKKKVECNGTDGGSSHSHRKYKKKSSLADGENRFSRDGHEQKTGFEIQRSGLEIDSRIFRL